MKKHILFGRDAVLPTALKKYRAQLGDSLWSAMGLVILNLVAQVAVFPLFVRLFGESGYGDIQYLSAYLNIFSLSAGCAATLSRMTSPPDRRIENNGDYHWILIGICLLGAPVIFLICRYGGVQMDRVTAICYYLLFVAMTLRYYVDVSYKLTLRYRRYFVFYCFVGVGYALGAFLAYKTRIWPLAFLPGELFGVLFAYIADGTLRRRALRISPAFGGVLKVTLLLCLSEGLSYLIANADRLILKLLIGASAVTVYYLATLVGKTMTLITIPLCGVLVGYLARYEGRLTRRAAKWMLLGSMISVAVFTCACVLGGCLMLWLLYPTEFDAVRPFLLVGSLSEVIFFTANILSVILVRFAKKSYQLIISGAFAVCFFGIGIPATLYGGLWGFALAVVGANLVRLLLCIALGLYWSRKKNAISDPISSENEGV